MYQIMLCLLVVAAIFQLYKPQAKINKFIFVILVGVLLFMQFFGIVRAVITGGTGESMRRLLLNGAS